MADLRTELQIDLRRAVVLHPIASARPPRTHRWPLDPWWHQRDGLSPSEVRAVARLVPAQQAR